MELKGRTHENVFLQIQNINLKLISFANSPFIYNLSQNSLFLLKTPIPIIAKCL